MRKVILVTIALLCSALWAFAQSSPSTSSSGQEGSSSASSSGGSSTTIDGCLSGSSGSYILKDKATGTSYNLTGDTSKLSAHVGHEVQVTGTTSNAGSSGSSSPTSSGNASSSGSGGQQTLSVTSMKHIATTCSAGQ